MITGEYENMIRELMEKTKTGEVKWRQTSCQSQFVVNFTGSSLTIMKGAMFHDNDKYIEIVLRSKSWIIIDYFNERSSDPWWDDLNLLFTGARRIACGIDDELRMIIDELKKNSVVEQERLEYKTAPV